MLCPFPMQVECPGGRVQQCLVPVATLLNHSAMPHIVRYGSLDAGSGMLHLRMVRWVPTALHDQLGRHATQQS